jgi:plastocyanin
MKGLALAGVVLAGVAAWPGTDPVPPRRRVVEIHGMAFHPALLEIRRGDTVVWVNRDLVPHTATGTGEPGWSTGRLLQEQSGRYVPQQSGEVPYFCELHPPMQGRLIVR